MDNEGSGRNRGAEVGRDLLGFGLLRPFQRDLKADFAAGGGEALVRSSVAQILGTMAASDDKQGEIPWRTDLGSGLYLLRNQRNDAILEELARVYVVDALKRWEPRVLVTSVHVSRGDTPGRNVLVIDLRYDVIAANVAGNEVLLAAVDQTVRLG